MLLIIGIDPGVSTGFAIYEPVTQKFQEVSTLRLHQAMLKVKDLCAVNQLFIIYEDARLATYGRNNTTNKSKLKGYGSVARDCKVWEEFAEDLEIKYHKTRPDKKLNKFCEEEDLWLSYTGHTGKTTHHARIAAAIAIKYNRYATIT